MRIYFDSSALAKIYIKENGTDEVLKYCDQATEVVLSCVIVPEIVSALNRRYRDGLLNKDQYNTLKKEFSLDIEDASIIDLSPTVVQTTITCLEKNPLRAFDAIHIASAKESYCNLFITADLRQYHAAKKLKLKSIYVGAVKN